MRFLCTRLCLMNPVGVARISWTAFFDTFYNSVNVRFYFSTDNPSEALSHFQHEQSDIVVENKFRKRLEFLIENCCPELRKRLLNMENFRWVQHLNTLFRFFSSFSNSFLFFIYARLLLLFGSPLLDTNSNLSYKSLVEWCYFQFIVVQTISWPFLCSENIQCFLHS